MGGESQSVYDVCGLAKSESFNRLRCRRRALIVRRVSMYTKQQRSLSSSLLLNATSHTQYDDFCAEAVAKIQAGEWPGACFVGSACWDCVKEANEVPGKSVGVLCKK